MVRKMVTNSKAKTVKTVFTLKPKHLSEGSEIFVNSFQILLKKLSNINHDTFVAENFGANEKD